MDGPINGETLGLSYTINSRATRCAVSTGDHYLRISDAWDESGQREESR